MPLRRRRGKAKAQPRKGQRRAQYEDDSTSHSEASSIDGESSDETDSELDAVEQILDDAEMERFWIPADSPSAEPATSQRFTNYCCVICLFIFAFCTFALRMVEEDYSVVRSSTGSGEDHYAILGISRHATATEVKRAYKDLALKWHPDKNRGCDECEVKFQTVARAYETLGTPSRRKTYDQVLGDAEPIPSAASSMLTDATYREEVLEQGDVWVIQVFDELEDACAHFAPRWERTAEELRPFARFGRIHARVDRHAVRLLPISPRVYPTVLLLAHGYQPAIFPWGNLEQAGKLKRWVLDSIPDSVLLLQSASEVQDFVSTPGSFLKLLLVSERTRPSHALRRFAINLEGQALVAQTRSEFAAGLNSSIHSQAKRSNVWLLAFGAAGLNQALQAWELPKKDPSHHGLWTSMQSAVRLHAAPTLHRGNVRQLCSSSSSDRVYCVVLLDEGEASTVTVALHALHRASKARLGVASTIKHGVDEGGQNQLQLVRMITTKPSVFHPEFAVSVKGVEAFDQMLMPALNGSSAFVLDLDAHRMAPLHGTISEIEAELSRLHDLIDSSGLLFQPLPLRDIREVLRGPESGGWLAARRLLKSASPLQLLGLLMVFLMPWLSFHFLNLQRFMIGIIVAPIILALLSDDFLWLLKQYWKSA